MDHSVAPYMIAIAVGDLAFKPLGPRTGVWAEPATLDAAAPSSSDTEKMVAAAEKLYGPYRWGRYDVLVLPPSFPLGGMENPDPDLPDADVHRRRQEPRQPRRARAIAQLVGQSGDQCDLERLLAQRGHDHLRRAAHRRGALRQEGADEQIALGIDALNKAITENGGPTGPDTRLHLDLKGRHPDDGLTDIAYEKGAAFLRTIEATSAANVSTHGSRAGSIATCSSR